MNYCVCTATNCRNSHENATQCDIWSRKGECQINTDWMAKNCQRSCRICDRAIGDDPRSRDETETTDDRNIPRNRGDDDEGTY